MASKGLPKEERLRILAEIKEHGFRVWPTPAEGEPYGPTPRQQEALDIPHKHPQDVVLYYGGRRAGKSVIAVAAGLMQSLTYSGIVGMVGTEQFNHLERGTFDDYRRMLSIRTDWDHPLVYKKPTTHNNRRLQFINGSSIYFVHFADFQILRGLELAWAHIEEASLLKDRSVFGEIQGRLSSSKVPCLRVFVTSNPEERKGWLYETFNLQQFEPTYTGAPMPVGKPCLCQFCSKCAAKELSVLWVDGVCPDCGTKKVGECPGDQYFWRVVMGDPKDNSHLPQHYRQTQKQSASEVEFDLYTRGQVIELRSNRCYANYQEKNNISSEVAIDYSKPMFWGFDFNIAYQCSTVVQEEDIGGTTVCNVIDEIVLPNASPEAVGREWMRRYKDFDQPVYFVFDPAAFNRSITADDGGVRVKMVRDVLENPEKYGFTDVKPKQCILLTRKKEGHTKVAVSARVDSVNSALNDGKGFSRLKVHPKCVWLIRSLEDVKWTENNGKPVIDVSVDKLAAKALDKKTVRTISHPTDALGYYIYKRFPVVGPRYAQMYGLLPGVGLITTSKDGKTVETTELKPKEFTDEEKEEKLKLVFDLDEPRPDPTKVTLRQMLDGWGAFETDDTPPILGYWN